jgi:hypothetical protein
MKRFATVALGLAVALSFAVSSLAVTASKLSPGTNATGFKWKRATDDDRRRYCEQISEKLGLGMKEWDVFYKSLNKTFDTETR